RSFYEQSLAGSFGPYNHAHAHLGLGRLHLAKDRLDEATAAADRLEGCLPTLTYSTPFPASLVGLRGGIAGRGCLAVGEPLLRDAINRLQAGGFELETLPWLYELRDLYQRNNRTPDAVRVMARALDLLGECGADDAISDVEEWLRQVDSPALTRLALERH